MGGWVEEEEEEEERERAVTAFLLSGSFSVYGMGSGVLLPLGIAFGGLLGCESCVVSNPFDAPSDEVLELDKLFDSTISLTSVRESLFLPVMAILMHSSTSAALG